MLSGLVAAAWALLGWLMVGYVLFRAGHLSYFCGIDLVGLLYLLGGPGAAMVGAVAGWHIGGRALPADRTAVALLGPIAIGLAVCGGFDPGLVVYPAPEHLTASRYPFAAVLCFAGLMLVELCFASQALAGCARSKLLALGAFVPASLGATALSMHAPGYVWAHALFLLVLSVVLAIGLVLQLAAPRRALVVVALATQLALGCQEHESVHFTAEQMASYRDARPDPSMPGPYWTLDAATVATLDERLQGLLADHPDERCKAVANHLGDDVVQYAGFTDGDGGRRVFVNGVDTRSVPADRARERFVVAGGGGNHFWQAVYDPGRRELTACRINDVR